MAAPRPVFSLLFVTACQPRPSTCPDPVPPATTASSAGVPTEPTFSVPSAPPPAAVGEALARISPDQLRATVDRLAAFGTRHTLSATDDSRRGIGAARRWIEREMKAAIASRPDDLPPATVEMDLHPHQPDGRRVDRPVDVVNVVATLPGTHDKERLYYVLGHYDSRASDVMNPDSDAPGANDDASGTAVVMELTRVLATVPLESTVVMVATAGEEQGLLGAGAHARAAKENGRDIRAVLSNDIVGDPSGAHDRTHHREIRVFSPALPTGDDSEELSGTRLLSAWADSPSRQLARYIAFVGRWQDTEVKPLLVWRNDRFLRGGDHTPFARAGFPAVRFSEVEENYDRQHQDPRTEGERRFGDFPEFVDESYLAGVTRLNAAAIIHLANAPSAPADCRIIVAELENDTTLRWTASPEPDVAGYEVVWRATTAPEWEGVTDVGEVTTASIPRSKDNFFFGVRAYDRVGYRSMVAFPRAARE